MDQDTFRNDLAVSKLCQGTHKELNELVECYNKTLTLVLDKHASQKNHSSKATRTVVQRSDFSGKKDEKKSRKKMALIKFYTRLERIQT